MDFEFDDTKDAINIANHGVSLALGEAVIRGLVGEAMDDRRNYGETRINAFGLIEGRLFACTYTIRSGATRIISVRKANRREQRKWLS